MLGNDQVDRASEIFVFRLVSAVADVADSDPISTRQVTGKIQIVDVFRGKPRIEIIRYSTSFCCGLRVDVGQFYAAFISEVGIEFSANTGNLLNLGELYEAGAPTARRLEEVTHGRRTFEQAFGKFPNDKMSTLPAPPPICSGKQPN